MKELIESTDLLVLIDMDKINLSIKLDAITSQHLILNYLKPITLSLKE